MRSNRSRLALFGVLALALSVTVGPAAAEAKKLKPFSSTQTVNAAIPPDVGGAGSTPLVSTITVGKKYRKRKVADVNVTGLQTTGDAAGAADDLVAKLTSPSGRTVWLFQNVGDQSLGPWTMDDDTHVTICDNETGDDCEAGSLLWPFAGTSNLLNNQYGFWPSGPLSNFDLVRMRGTWTLRVFDVSTPGTNSVLNQWGLKIKPLKLKPPTVQVD